jgi:PadR family transcriptional regulator AphA
VLGKCRGFRLGGPLAGGRLRLPAPASTHDQSNETDERDREQAPYNVAQRHSLMETTTELTTAEYAVLGLLAFGERSGYDLARAAGRSIGYMWAPSRSQIYKVLPRLVRAGCAESSEVEQRGKPDKELYRVTENGRAALRSWVEQVDEKPSGGIGIFLLKLFFGWAAPPEAALTQLEAYRRLIEKRLADFEAMEQELDKDEPPHSRIALRHGIARARATLAWADETRRNLEGLQARRTILGPARVNR